MEHFMRASVNDFTDIETIEDAEEKANAVFRAFGNWLDDFLPQLIRFGINLIIALVIFFIGRKVVKWIGNILKRSFERSNMEAGVEKFLLSFINIVMYVFLGIIVITILGVESSSIMAVIGSAGLAVGLALQGSLSNLAGGVLILIMKPFQIGDYIIAGNDEGNVTSIDIFYTRLLTVDNQKIVIPNGNLSNMSIVNVTHETNRRVDILVGIAYKEDIKKVKKLIEALVVNHPLVLKEEPIDIYVSAFEASSVSVGLRVWTETDNYWKLKWDLLENIKETFDANGIEIPFEQLDVNINQ